MLMQVILWSRIQLLFTTQVLAVEWYRGGVNSEQ